MRFLFACAIALGAVSSHSSVSFAGEGFFERQRRIVGGFWGPKIKKTFRTAGEFWGSPAVYTTIALKAARQDVTTRNHPFFKNFERSAVNDLPLISFLREGVRNAELVVVVDNFDDEESSVYSSGVELMVETKFGVRSLIVTPDYVSEDEQLLDMKSMAIVQVGSIMHEIFHLAYASERIRYPKIEKIIHHIATKTSQRMPGMEWEDYVDYAEEVFGNAIEELVNTYMIARKSAYRLAANDVPAEFAANYKSRFKNLYEKEQLVVDGYVYFNGDWVTSYYTIEGDLLRETLEAIFPNSGLELNYEKDFDRISRDEA